MPKQDDAVKRQEKDNETALRTERVRDAFDQMYSESAEGSLIFC